MQWPYLVLFLLCLAGMIAAQAAVHAKPIYARLVWVFIALLFVAGGALFLTDPPSLG